ncbi:hypothetical protein PHISCL_06411 [Aspergillus sclerotialis]|uniref:DUF2423 domain-containing protein n=1 Tax=Aspergillus sclerotialis TaxID=2070753 RepID=A0A3A2ZFA0_9EURO|nr:hypothetical protein PHISCL_06411 [Aspergillus sclerotialis]
MAKSVRASVSKRNRAKLRSTVFAPADNARTERLSAKLQEIASRPKPKDRDMSDTDLGNLSAGDRNRDHGIKPARVGEEEDMDVDQSPKTTTSQARRPERIQKRKKRARSSIVFPSHPLKTKSGSRRK